MAELIDKGALIREIEEIKFSEDAKRMKVTYDANMDGFFKGLVDGMIGFMPTTTEAEIRNKAIKDFMKEIRDWQIDIRDNEYDAEKYDFVFERIYEIAEQMKESE